MKKHLFSIAAVVLAVAFSAFTTIKTHKIHHLTGTYWYTFEGTQTPEGRMDKTQYTNPTTVQPQCSGQLDECAVQVKNINGTPPSDISNLNISFDENGFPSGGTDFSNNLTKD